MARDDFHSIFVLFHFFLRLTCYEHPEGELFLFGVQFISLFTSQHFSRAPKFQAIPLWVDGKSSNSNKSTSARMHRTAWSEENPSLFLFLGPISTLANVDGNTSGKPDQSRTFSPENVSKPLSMNGEQRWNIFNILICEMSYALTFEHTHSRQTRATSETKWNWRKANENRLVNHPFYLI